MSWQNGRLYDILRAYMYILKNIGTSGFFFVVLFLFILDLLLVGKPEINVSGKYSRNLTVFLRV